MAQEQNRPTLSPRFAYFKLFLNHMDAWQVALVVASLPLLIHEAIRLETALLVGAIGVGYWYAFALNDYLDAPFDSLDHQKRSQNFFVLHPVPGHRLIIFSFALLLILAMVYGLFGFPGWLIWGISCFVAWAYSAPPIRLKNRPGLDLLTHAMFVQTFPYVASMVLIQAAWGLLDAVLVGILFLASLTAQLEQQARDYGVDIQTGGTFTTWVGQDRVVRGLRLATAVCLLLALFSVVNGTIPWYLLPFGLIGLPALLHRFWRQPDAPRSERLVLLSTTAGFLYTGFIFCYFLLS